jgi:5'(3')-deoxyribonucleotidase
MKLDDFVKEEKKYTLYVDMDGVLCDFLKGASEATGLNFKQHSDWTKHKDTAWRVLADIGSRFWARLPWNKNGKKLWNYVRQYEPRILSAFPQATENKQYAIDGKKEWIKKNLTGVKEINLVRGQDKQLYARKDAILIDDSKRNIDQFNAAGGIGILHKNTNDTIRKLQKLL